jgi:hypothetical protein
MSQSTTERAQYVFSVKEFSDGAPWIMLEAREEGLSTLGDGFLGLELRNGVPIGDAEKLAQLLRQIVLNVAFTSFAKNKFDR